MNLEEKINPSHYGNGKDIECIDVMIQQYGVRDTMAFCKCNALKYMYRLGHKDDEEVELNKIKWYIDKYIELKGRL